MDENKIGKVGASEISKLFTEQGLKAKTAQSLAYEKARELIDGYKKDFTTPAMQHGIFSEEEAYYSVVHPFYPNSKYRSKDSIWINDRSWATPDVVDDHEGITMDIKCPFTVYTYWENVKKLPKGYYFQNQMQLVATGHKKGSIVLFLTSNNMDDWGNKIEYEIPIDERHHYFFFDKDDDAHKEIIKRLDDFFPLRDIILECLAPAPVLSDVEFFNLAKDGAKITMFKRKSNLTTWAGQIYKNGNEYYVIENI